MGIDRGETLILNDTPLTHQFGPKISCGVPGHIKFEGVGGCLLFLTGLELNTRLVYTEYSLFYKNVIVVRGSIHTKVSNYRKKYIKNPNFSVFYTKHKLL